MGTLVQSGSGYDQLRIAFPDGNDKDKVTKFLSRWDDEKNPAPNFVVTPNYAKERELLRRKKDAVTKARTGMGLKNSRLKEFIFDSSKATPSKEFENMVIENTEEYQECKRTRLLPLNPS